MVYIVRKGNRFAEPQENTIFIYLTKICIPWAVLENCNLYFKFM